MSEEQCLHHSINPLADSFDNVLFDLDGVIYAGTQAIPGAVDGLRALRARGVRTGFVTNNANRTPEAVSQQLNQLGIESSANEVITSAQAAAHLIADEFPAGSSVLCVGGPGLEQALTVEGLAPVTTAEDNPVAVVQGFAPSVNWAALAEASYAIERGAVYYATNIDQTIPTERGRAPGNGTLVNAVAVATGVTPISAGKPAPALYQRAVEVVGEGRTLMVGDRLDTDLAGARALAIPGMLVLTGVSSARDAVFAQPLARPAYIGLDVTDLLVPHPQVTVTHGRVTCGSKIVRIKSDVLYVNDTPLEETVTLDALRALCVMSWWANDSGSPIREQWVPNLVVTRDNETRKTL